jgi:hypothetical protein
MDIAVIHSSNICGMQWWLVQYSYGRAGCRIIICLLRRPNRVFLSAQPANHVCLADTAGLNFLT